MVRCLKLCGVLAALMFTIGYFAPRVSPPGMCKIYGKKSIDISIPGACLFV
jgi:hypothetical protein